MNIEEIENNLNYVEDMAHNLFKFRIKEMTYSEALLKFKKHLRNQNYVQACDIAQAFFEEYEKAIIMSEPYISLRKAHFNTLRVEIKNAVSDNTKK